MAIWTEGRYASWSADLGHGHRLHVHLGLTRTEGDNPYVASAMDLRLKHRFATLEEAKAAAERAARQILTRALAALDEGE